MPTKGDHIGKQKCKQKHNTMGALLEKRNIKMYNNRRKGQQKSSRKGKHKGRQRDRHDS